MNSTRIKADQGQAAKPEAPSKEGRVISMVSMTQVLRIAATLIIVGGAVIWLLSPAGPLSGGDEIASGGQGSDVPVEVNTTSAPNPFAVHARFPELQQVEEQYEILVTEKKDLLVNNEKFEGEDRASVLAFLDELETEYTLLESEIESLNDPDKLIGAMILNYQQRIEVLERLMELLNTSPSDKADKYEMPLSFRDCLVLFFILLPALAGAKGLDVELTNTVDTLFVKANSPFEIDLENKYGDVTIDVWDRADISVNVFLRVRGKDEEKAQKIMDELSVNMVQSGNYLRLQTLTKSSDKGQVKKMLTDISPFDKTKIDIDYRLKVPASASLELLTKFGDVNIGNLLGEINATISYGDLRADRLPRNTNIDFSFGKADIVALESGKIILKNANLDLRAARTLELSSSSSHIDIERVQRLTIFAKRDDYRINEVEFLDGEASFTDLRVRLLKDGGDLELSFGICEIEQLSPGFRDLSIDQRNCEVELNVGSLDFDLQAYLDQGKLVLPQSLPGLDVNYIDQKKEIRTITAGLGSKSRIILKGKGGEIVFFR